MSAKPSKESSCRQIESIREKTAKRRTLLPAVLPEGWVVDDLLREHAPLPYNPNIANAFFRAGEIEAWAVSSRTGGERPTEAAGEASVKTSVKASVKTGDALLELLRKNPQMTLAEVAALVRPGSPHLAFRARLAITALAAGLSAISELRSMPVGAANPRLVTID